MAQTDILLTKEPAPQTVPACQLPRKLYDVARNTGAHTSSGLATSGFRTAKYLLDEWFQNCYARYHQAFADRDQSERQRHESQQLAAETEALAQRTQQDSTRKVGERLQDMHGWKSELQRQVEELVSETELLLAQKQRLERALDATAGPFSIVTDNLQCRERRQHPDLVRDCVEIELLKAELGAQGNLRDGLVRQGGGLQHRRGLLPLQQPEHRRAVLPALGQVRGEVGLRDPTWAPRPSAGGPLCSSSAPGVGSASTPETWAKFTQEHLYRAERERLASVNLRNLIDCILQDTSEDLRLQCDAVNLAFGRRCEELEDARHKLEHHLRKTLREISDQEHNIAALKQAIKDKEAPLKVAQTRLYQRSHRPNVELCRDAAQFRLASEVEELNLSLAALKEKLLEAEQSLHNLEDTRMSLEKDIAIKTNSLFIDRHKCMAHRAHYPTVLQLAGYQ